MPCAFQKSSRQRVCTDNFKIVRQIFAMVAGKQFAVRDGYAHGKWPPSRRAVRPAPTWDQITSSPCALFCRELLSQYTVRPTFAVCYSYIHREPLFCRGLESPTHGIIFNAVRRPTATVPHTEKVDFPVVWWCACCPCCCRRSAGWPAAVINDEVLGTTALVWPSGCVEGVQCLIGESMVSWKWLMEACVYIAEKYVVRASLVKESNG
jgi:hypothetical protein